MVDRRSLTMKDMWGAVGVLAVVLVVVLGLMGTIGFGNDTKNGETPVADVTGGLQKSAAALRLPLLIPQGLPADWQPNSFALTDPFTDGGTRTVVRGGWITGSGRFVALIQSTDSPADLIGNEIGPGLTSRAVVAAGGLDWDVYPGQRSEVSWVHAAGRLAVMITGSASEDDFRILAESIA
ncbi:MAG: DUF4245 family protein [Nakamurella sp.]